MSARRAPRSTTATTVIGVLALAACGGARAAEDATRGADAGASKNDAATAPGPSTESYASLEALAARGPSEAPLMRELLRVDRAAPRSLEVRADRDLCVRAVFAAARPVRAWFADAAGATRGEVAAGIAGTVPPRGPVCATKGESLHLVVESGEGTSTASVSARAIIFAAP